MNPSVRRGLVACAIVLLTSATSGYAQERIRIALWEVENNTEQSWGFSSQMGPAARNYLDTEFSQNPALSSTFVIVERDKLSLVMKEQGLAASGAINPQTAAKVGALLGVKYIVVGGIDKFTLNNTGGRLGSFGGIGGNLQQATATINLRFIDTTTGERVMAMAGDAEVRKGGGFVRDSAAGRDNQWGLASETIEKASKAAVAKFVAAGYVEKLAAAAAPPRGLEARVVKIDGDRLYINVGAESGIKVGDRFAVFAVGEALIDPVTGANLGAEEKQTGTASVTDVQAKFAIATVTGKADAKAVLRRLP
jgi:curli biogenesis system outer membrane secretion channel CsgG